MKIVLTLTEDLSPEEVASMRILLNDALGEFQSARGYQHWVDEDTQFERVASYVKTRYPDLGGELLWLKVSQVMGRCATSQRVKGSTIEIIK